MPYKKHKQYRLPGYDYAQNGNYFITVVTKNREKHFGEIVDDKMIFSTIGKFTEDNFQVLKTKELTVKVTEHIIMPDHLHMILNIGNDDYIQNLLCDGVHPLEKDSVSSFVNHLKGYIKNWCNKKNHPYFEWQDRFHDRIIRDVEEHKRIVWYMQTNVINWKNDVP